MRHFLRTLRHSSLSLFLVPLAMPLVMVVTQGTRGPVDAEKEAAQVQEVIQDTRNPAPTDLPVTTPPLPLHSDTGPFEADTLRQARLALVALLKG